MKPTFIVLLALCLCLPVIGADKKPLTKEETEKIIEAAIRERLKKPKDELTKADLEKVMSLNLSTNQLTDVKGLENLTQLTRLSLSGNKLTDVKGLEKLTQFTRLALSGTKLTDVKGLENLTQLTHLNLFSNQLTDVKGLEKLMKLELSYNPDLTKAQIAELQKALPKCNIVDNATK